MTQYLIRKIYSWFWIKKKPINYNPKRLCNPEVKMQDQL